MIVGNFSQLKLNLIYIVLWCMFNVRGYYNFGPSIQPEAYFNGSSYLRLQTTISLKKQTGISFKTCTGGSLISQQQNDELIELSVNSEGVTFFARTSGKLFEDKILGNYLNNQWHTVQLIYKLGNLTLNVDNQIRKIANATYNYELLINPNIHNEGATVLLIGKQFVGCLLEGPSLVFDNKIILSSLNVRFEKCPIPDDSCIAREITKGYDFCLTEPCMRHGTCINGQSTYTCTCLPRYTGKNCEIDIGNPCEKSPSLCKNGATCSSDISGEYTCTCISGFTGKHCEQEIRLQQLCKSNPCLNGATCNIDNNGKVDCTCLPGFIGGRCELNIDDCKSNPCQHGGVCIDGLDNFTCDCARTGYTGKLCENNINECLNNPCKYGGSCFDTYGDYICECLPGYGGINCEYVMNECLSTPCLNNGECIDQPGSDGYDCHCLSGFGGKNCEKIEKRQRQCDSTNCSYFADCIDIGNNIECVCKQEYPGIYPNCSADNVCINEPCKNGGICTPWRSTFNCSCQPGFTDTNCDFQVNCTNNPCINAISCHDYYGGYYCTCKSGWTGLNCNLELELCSSHPCNNGATCIEQIDIYICHCAPGFAGKLCQINIDDCSSSPCLNGGTCLDQINGYICNCTEQWMGMICDRLYDVCEYKKPCFNNATCIPSLSLSSQSPSILLSQSLVSSLSRHDFICNCLPGFEGDFCEINIDDCIGIECSNGKVCVDLINHYECLCPSGYTGENCTVDLDPCGKEPCLKGSTCQIDLDTRDFKCICAPGFTGPRCNIDIDECTLPNVKICNEGICVNKEGSFQCYCTPGYTGERCDVDFDECLSMPCKNNATCLNKVNNYECICPPGYKGKDCSVDINECESMPCEDGSTCIDGINEFTCICQPGLTGKTCNINIDDCASSPCLNGAHCVDGLNSYTCNCKETGYTGEHCEINIDDCIGDPCYNGAECIDEIKDYHCNCYPGYTGKNCEQDINECESNPCKYSGICLQKSNASLYLTDYNLLLPDLFSKPFNFANASGYVCLCVPGVTGENCEININECESSPCFQGTCVDKIGGYFCECDEGFEGEHCDIDINECEKYKPCIHGKCIDKKANYYCDCEANFGGKNCSVALIGCADNPCLNDGSCKPYVINENIHKFNCSCPNGFHGQKCEKVSTMSLSGNSLVMVNTSREEGYDIQFRFKTTLADGLLALGKGLTYYILELSKGRLNLHSSLLNKWEGVFIGSNLNDSQWQRVFVAINSTHLVLSANDEQTIYPITFNENYNVTYTSFPFTYIGGIPSNLKKLTHGPPFLVGCTEDVLINGEWVLPGENMSGMTFQNVDIGCLREPQCNPNPCHSGGHCTDMWRDFSCNCERPYLGHTCQYNYTAATFGYENITDSLVTVNVADSARRAVRTIVDISMFIRTRQSRGQIFYLGSALNSANLMDETYIAAQLESGELLVRIQFNGTPEAYTVGGVKLDNGYNHLIEVIRNITLVQVKLNGTEYFRKTISATGALDAQILFLGGQPQLRSVRQAATINSNDNMIKIDNILQQPTAPASSVGTPLSNVHFKGIIQDVQISNGSSIMVVEFFPLQADDLEIPMPFGNVTFDKSTVLEGIHSDNSCKINPCYHNGKCINTWNDYYCDCPRGFKGKDCTDQEFCELEECPHGSECKNLDDGYECLANASFNGKMPALQYSLAILENSTKLLNFDTLELTYRTRSWGTLMFIKYKDDYFTIFIYHNEVVVEWNMDKVSDSRRFRKDHFEGQWLTLYFVYKETALIGGFKDAVMDESPNFHIKDFNINSFIDIVKNGIIYIGGSDNATFDYHSVIENSDYNMTGYIPTSDTTTVPFSNSLENNDFYNNDDVYLMKVDQNKQTDSFKGCLGEIRIGGMLLPFFTTKEIYRNNQYSEEFFDLIPTMKPEIGCILCYSNDCFNDGFCINSYETYKCNCSDGYTADDCSIDINECENNQCQNNATCKDLVAKYECECLPGYDGKNCENDIDECQSNPCKHGGSCIDLVGNFKCECPDEFVGKQCEAPLLITCDNKPCKDGSTCKTGPNEKTGNNFTCICTEGMEGPLCDTPFCSKQPCEKGICNTTFDIPFCQCQRGFEGKYCEINIDDCVSPAGGIPCQNNGICIDGINRYDCNCNGTGYTGLLCEMDIDECNINKFACDRGVCENLPGNYKCICEDKNKCGHYCALDDPCLENPCKNGDCKPQCFENADYVCNCNENYTGKNCTQLKLAASHSEGGINILFIVIPIVIILMIGFIIGMVVLVNIARSKRATRGTYSPSAQEFCNPRVELDHVLKPPPEERLI